jgi:tRNA threonylcarbamoyladenosine biosynthesis protein TsaE
VGTAAFGCPAKRCEPAEANPICLDRVNAALKSRSAEYLHVCSPAAATNQIVIPKRSEESASCPQHTRCRRTRFYTGPVSHGSKANELRREITTHSAEETIAFGRTLAELLSPPKLVLLRGDLGAGKTTLVKGIAAAFEAACEDDVTSPTFTLIHEYRGTANLFHIDLYRIETPRELDTLALDDLRGENSILLIEWGEKFPRLVRERDVEIALDRQGESGRRIRVSV